MKFRLLLTFLVTTAVCARADLVWEKPVQQFHRTPDEPVVHAQFAFKNTGPETITIKRISTGCGCTSAKLDRKTYAPGESGAIEVKYTSGGRPGAWRRYISVSSEDKRFWKLDMQVYIHEPLTVAPSLVWWRVGDAPEAKSVRLKGSGGHSVAVKSVRSSNPRIEASVDTVRDGEEYVIAIKPADTSTKESAELTVVTDFPPDAPRDYRIFARIK